MPSFVEIGPPVPEERIFKSFTIYGRGGNLGHVTCTIYINFGSPFTKKLHLNIGFD